MYLDSMNLPRLHKKKKKKKKTIRKEYRCLGMLNNEVHKLQNRATNHSP